MHTAHVCRIVIYKANKPLSISRGDVKFLIDLTCETVLDQVCRWNPLGWIDVTSDSDRKLVV